MNKTNNKNIRPTLLATFSGFKNFGYTYASAIPEFIDNSIASFIDHAAIIKQYELHNKPFEKSIMILFDKKENQIIIRDTAMGIQEKDFQRSLRIGQKKNVVTGLNEFGKGLKAAAFWFGRDLEIKTRSYFDYKNGNKKFANGAQYGIYWQNVENDNPYINPIPINMPTSGLRLQHGTVVTIRNIYPDRMPTNSDLKKLVKSISSKYRIFILNDNIKIYIYVIDTNDDIIDMNKWCLTNKKTILMNKNLSEGQPLTFKETPIHKDINGVEKKVHFSFDVKSNNNKLLKVRGYFFQREKGSRSEAGIDLYRRGRIIEEKFTGFYPDQSGFKYQRINGSMYLDDFPVTQTKDKILWEGELFEKVLAKIQETKEIQQFNEYVDSYRTHAQNDEKVIEKLGKFINEDSTEFYDENITIKKISRNNNLNNDIPFTTLKNDLTYECELINKPEPIIIVSRLINDNSLKSWMDVEVYEHIMLVKLDINHVFFSPFNDVKVNHSFSETFIRTLRTFSIFWAIAEKICLDERLSVDEFRERLCQIIERNQKAIKRKNAVQ